MNKQTQKDIVYRAITHILGDRYREGQPVELTKEEKRVAAMLVEKAFVKQGVMHRKEDKLHNDHYLKTYSRGLVANWIKRDPRLTGKAKTQKDNSSVSDAYDEIVDSWFQNN